MQFPESNKNRNHTEFEQIYRKYSPSMLNFAYSYVMDRAAAEDIVQDAFSKLWHNISRLADIRDIRNYLFKQLRNACLNHLRHLDIEDRHQDKLVEALISSQTYDYLEEEELKQRIADILGALPEKQREVMRMKYFDELKYSEIAERLSISEETVRTHVKRAMNNLKHTLPFVLFLLLIE